MLWTQSTCVDLRKAGRVGERPPVAFSGIHQSLPAWHGAQAGDEVFALTVNRCVVYVVSRMRVLDLERRECCGPAPTTWRESPYPGHKDWSMLGSGGCGAAAVHVEATPVSLDVPLPGELLGRLTWQNRRGQTRGLKYVVDGRLERFVSLQGFYRLTRESAVEISAVVDNALQGTAVV